MRIAIGIGRIRNLPQRHHSLIAIGAQLIAGDMNALEISPVFAFAWSSRACGCFRGKSWTY
jgi:hypothetical protein